MRLPKAVLFGLLGLLGGCSQYGYRYQPHPQVAYSPIFADYKVQDQSVDILVDTDGLRLEEVAIQLPDGKAVKPMQVDYPPFKPELLGGTDDVIYGPDLAQGPTVAHFNKSDIGPGPWNVRTKIQDVPSKTILVGAAPRDATDIKPRRS